jgi:hypothetical protein
MAEKSPGEERAKGLYQAAVEHAKGLAPHFQPGYGTKELTPDEIDLLFDQRALSVEQEHELWRATKEDGTPMYSPEEIGTKVFPERLKLASGGGRFEPKDQHAWINKQAKRAEQRRAQQQAMTEPDPMMTEPTPLPSEPQQSTEPMYGEEV